MSRGPTGTCLTLSCHPATPALAVHSITLGVTRRGNRLRLDYRLHADLARLKIPTRSARSRRDGLWRNTCVELFLGDAHRRDYLELNFAPSGAYAAYRFGGYRRARRMLSLAAPPRISTVRTDQRLALTILLDVPRLAAWPPGTLRMGASAVVEEHSGSRSYWALHHPHAKPDFHHSAAWLWSI